MCGNSIAGHQFDHRDFAGHIQTDRAGIERGIQALYAKGDFDRAADLIADNKPLLRRAEIDVTVPPAFIAAAVMAAHHANMAGVSIFVTGARPV